MGGDSLGFAWEDAGEIDREDAPRRVTWDEINGSSDYLAVRDGRRWHTTGEIAESLNVCTHTVRNLIKRGRLRAVRVGHVWRISPGALEQFLRESR